METCKQQAGGDMQAAKRGRYASSKATLIQAAKRDWQAVKRD